MSTAAAKKYALLVHGRPSEISTTRTRGDPADVDRYKDQAVLFVMGSLMKDGSIASTQTGTPMQSTHDSIHRLFLER